MTAKSATAAKIENENDFDETLYEARRLRAGLNILIIDPNNISEFGYCELLQLAWMFQDQLEKYIKDVDGIIEDLISAGAKDYKTPA